MFPSNLHKNIVQLDRQISLLEKECENMEAETRRKSLKSDSTHCRSSRISNLQMKSPKVKLCLKKNEGSKKNKITPPRSAKIQSSSSVQSQCSKSCNDNSGTFIGRKSKAHGGNNYLQGCNCQTVNQTQCNLKDYKSRSSGCNDKHLPDLAKDENTYISKGDHVLHKKVLIPNPGSTIEVTVTQKSKSKESLPIKTINIASAIEKNIESCKCQAKGPKWSEILYLESAKRKGISNGSSVKSQTSTGVKHLVSPSLKFDFKNMEQHIYHNNNNSSSNNNINNINDNIKNVEVNHKKSNLEVPVKLSPEVLRNKAPSETDRKHFKELQSYLETNSGEEKKILLPAADISKKTTPTCSPSGHLPEKMKANTLQDSSVPQNEFFSKLQQNCQNIMKEKEKVADELAAKENILKTMRKREEEYISIITSLKSNLEKLKVQSQEDAKALRESNIIAAQLAEQKKISEAIKKGHITLQNMFERCSLENYKLQTQIKLLKLESQKHDVLLAGKDAEINRYKEEIKNFQRQLADHMELLKSSSQGLDVEKMMESIIQQSQLFFQSNFKSVLSSNEQKETSKPNLLMHSSPTSTKTSNLNSSWNQISSIHEHDQSRDESDFVINLKEDSPDKEFFHIFGDGSSSGSKSPKSPETLLDELSNKTDLKNSSSFTSCVSLRDDSDFSETKKEVVSRKPKQSLEPDANKVALRRVQSNIDGLLKNLKLKWSKEIFESSGGDSTIKDFLNDSQISSITQ